MSILEDKRREIDAIDAKIMALLARRMQVAKLIGRFKKRAGLKAKDERREKKVLQRVRKLAGELGLKQQVVEKIFGEILAENTRVQNEETITSGFK